MKKLFKILKWTLITLASLVILIGIVAFFYMKQAKFGASPSGERLARIQKSPNYKNGKFQNISETPTFAEGYSITSEVLKMMFKKYPRLSPTGIIPSVKTDLLHLSADTNVLVWFGHSSCFIKVGGKTLLLDPVFSGNASPVSGSLKSFPGTDVYKVSDLPDIDYILISHDHYDHLDYETILALKDKTKHVVCGLGVGAHFEAWGYPAEKILEKDWHESVTLDPELTIFTEPARHVSGRGLIQDNTLWISFVIKSKDKTIFYSGDGGYDKHFAMIGKKYGPLDLAIIENGQYDSAWRYIHCLPPQVVQAAKDLNAKRLLPVHNSKFLLGRHPWDEPLKRTSELSEKAGIPLVTPMIGQLVNLNDEKQHFSKWWQAVN